MNATLLKRTCSLTVLLALVHAGSEGGESAPPTASQEQDIIGGTVTTARPEVAQFLLPSGSYCTATLISDRHFLTASHCINYAGLFRGGTLRINGSTDLSVDRAFGEGSQVGDADWAVGRLNAPVSPTLATPAGVSSTEPANEYLTAMGYGCTDRGTGTGGGIKRYIEYYYSGGFDNWGCPGDSGGPVFHGTLAATGTIVRVHSGIWTDPFYTYDVGADVPRFYNHIQSLVTGLEDTGVCYRPFIQDNRWMPV